MVEVDGKGGLLMRRINRNTAPGKEGEGGGAYLMYENQRARERVGRKEGWGRRRAAKIKKSAEDRRGN